MATSRVLAASCDKHLVHLVTSTAPGDAPADVRLTELRTVDARYNCMCRVPAQWVVRTLPKEETE